MYALFEVVMPVFIVIGLGYLMVWRGIFSEEGVDLLMKFSQGIALPALLFLAISRLDLSQDFHFPMLLSYYSGSVFVFLMGIFGARVIFGRLWTDAVAIGFAAMFANSLLLGLPIMERAYGPESLAGNYAIVALHAPLCYLVGVTAMEGVKAGRMAPHILALAVGRALSRNSLTLAIGAGFVVNVIGIGMPIVVEDGIALLARAGLPTALFGLGGVLYRYRPEGEVRVIAMVLILSLMCASTASTMTS
ncbi:MAG: AEC family transporter, partial [Paracoccaceae bacterium]